MTFMTPCMIRVQINLPSFRSIHVFLHNTPIRILYHAMTYFRDDCPKIQPSIITTEFYLNQFKDALTEAVLIKVR